MVPLAMGVVRNHLICEATRIIRFTYQLLTSPRDCRFSLGQSGGYRIRLLFVAKCRRKFTRLMRHLSLLKDYCPVNYLSLCIKSLFKRTEIRKCATQQT